MALTIKAAVAFHFFGVTYAKGDVIDTAAMSDEAIAQLLRHEPVYVSESGGSSAVGDSRLSLGSTGAVSVDGVITFGVNATAGSDLALSSDGLTVHFVTEGVYAVNIFGAANTGSGSVFQLAGTWTYQWDAGRQAWTTLPNSATNIASLTQRFAAGDTLQLTTDLASADLAFAGLTIVRLV